jgi:hypothetical protein
MKQALQPMIFFRRSSFKSTLILLPGYKLGTEHFLSLDTLKIHAQFIQKWHKYSQLLSHLHLLIATFHYLLIMPNSCQVYWGTRRVGSYKLHYFHQHPIKAGGRTWRVTTMHNLTDIYSESRHGTASCFVAPLQK